MRAVVCGAGIAGLAQAWWLERSGWDVTVLEIAPRLRDEGYMLDFFGPGYDSAERMGLLPALHDVAYRVPEVRWLRPDGRVTGRIDYGRMRHALGGRLLSVLRPDLERVLADAVGGRCELRFGTSVAAVTLRPGGVEVHDTRGGSERADLLVGADGISSRVRELVFGPARRFLRDLGYHTAAYLFRDDELHARLERSFHIVRAPGRQAGCYPLTDGRIATFFVHRSAARDLPTDPAAALRDVYAGMGPIVARMLAGCPPSPALFYDRVAQVVLPAWHQQRVVLVGDACHAPSLLAGQGASLAMAGAAVLADALRRDPDVDVALDVYQARMRPATAAIQASGRATARWFVPANRVTLALRDRMVSVIGRYGTGLLLRGALTSPDPRLAVAAPQNAATAGA